MEVLINFYNQWLHQEKHIRTHMFKETFPYRIKCHNFWKFRAVKLVILDYPSKKKKIFHGVYRWVTTNPDTDPTNYGSHLCCDSSIILADASLIPSKRNCPKSFLSFPKILRCAIFSQTIASATLFYFRRVGLLFVRSSGCLSALITT